MNVVSFKFNKNWKGFVNVGQKKMGFRDFIDLFDGCDIAKRLY
jgi:hypothetical protein